MSENELYSKCCNDTVSVEKPDIDLEEINICDTCGEKCDVITLAEYNEQIKEYKIDCDRKDKE